ncbi:MAG: hypothetical protein AAF211_13585, partial [Myxococcota bacterium]
MIRLRILFVAAALACPGADPESGPDSDSGTRGSPTGSTGADTGTPPTPTGPVAVRVVSDAEGTPVAEAGISVADAWGAFLFAGQTDAQGEASLDEVPDGASVSVVVRVPTDDGIDDIFVDTVFGVQGSDQLAFGRERRDARIGPGRIDFDIETAPVPQPPYDSVVFAECGGQQFVDTPATETIPLEMPCRAGSVDLLAVNYTDSRAHSFIPATVELVGVNLTASVSLTGWSTEHGVVGVTPPNVAADSWFSASVTGRFGAHILSVGSTGFTDAAAPFQAVVSPALEPLFVESNLDRAYRLDRIDPIPGVGQAVDIAPGPDDFLPSWGMSASGLASARPGITLEGVGDSPACGDMTADLVRGMVERGREPSAGVYANTAWRFVGPIGSTFTLPELDPAQGPVWPEGTEPRYYRGSSILVAHAEADYAELRQRPGATLPEFPDPRRELDSACARRVE